MENIEQKIRQIIEGALTQKYSAVKKNQIMAQLEELSIINLIATFVSCNLKEKQDMIERLEKENKGLKSRLNQVSFQNDPNRDKQILKLHRQGVSNSGIGRIVGISRQGVAKALKRLHGNSVNTQ